MRRDPWKRLAKPPSMDHSPAMTMTVTMTVTVSTSGGFRSPRNRRLLIGPGAAASAAV